MISVQCFNCGELIEVRVDGKQDLLEHGWENWTILEHGDVWVCPGCSKEQDNVSV